MRAEQTNPDNGKAIEARIKYVKPHARIYIDITGIVSALKRMEEILNAERNKKL